MPLKRRARPFPAGLGFGVSETCRGSVLYRSSVARTSAQVAEASSTT